ncbi:MAG: right-handed parallel beta-helix repeat-containing protein [Candidatus Hodarchaeales archaeon]
MKLLKLLNCTSIKDKTTIKLIIIPVIVIVLLSVSFSNAKSETSHILLSRTEELTHDPIHIIGNDDFLAQAQNEGWKGNGSLLNPIIIQGLTIQSKTADLIYIRNVDLHFKIKNCLLKKGANSITFYYVQNGQLVNNTIIDEIEYESVSKSKHGIYLFQSSDNLILNNSILGKRGEGIFLDYFSNNNTVYGNIIEHESVFDWTLAKGNGIQIENSHNNSIFLNFLTRRSENGLFLYKSSNNIIWNNTMSENRINGISASKSLHNVILSNNITNNRGSGVIFRDSNFNTLEKNNISCNEGDSITPVFYSTYFSNCSNIYFLDNILQENKYEFAIIQVTNITVFDNVFLGSEGIVISKSKNIRVQNNTLSGMLEAVELDNCCEIDVLNNTMKNNFWGLNLYYSSMINIQDNLIYMNKIGLLSFSFSYSRIQSNIFYNNSKTGLLIWGGMNNSIHGNTLLKNGDGIVIQDEVKYCIISNNTIKNSNFSGLFMQYTSNNSVNQNTIMNNCLDGIRLFECSYSDIYGNLVENNSLNGIYLTRSYYNRIWNNNIRFNDRYGINLNYSFSNVVRYNNFIKNNPAGNSQAFDAENPGGGTNIIRDNYWDDLVSPDNNSDGIVDTPYLIDGSESNQDLKPSMTPINSTSPPPFAPPGLYPTTSSCPGFELSAILIIPILIIFLRRKF